MDSLLDRCVIESVGLYREDSGIEGGDGEWEVDVAYPVRTSVLYASVAYRGGSLVNTAKGRCKVDRIQAYL